MSNAAKLVVLLSLLLVSLTSPQVEGVLEQSEDGLHFVQAPRVCGFHFVSSSIEQVGGVRLRGGAVWTPVYVVRQQRVPFMDAVNILRTLVQVTEAAAVSASEADSQQADEGKIEPDGEEQEGSLRRWMEATAEGEGAAASAELPRAVAVREVAASLDDIGLAQGEDMQRQAAIERAEEEQREWSRQSLNRAEDLLSSLQQRAFGPLPASLMSDDSILEARAGVLHALHQALMRWGPAHEVEVETALHQALMRVGPAQEVEVEALHEPVEPQGAAVVVQDSAPQAEGQEAKLPFPGASVWLPLRAGADSLGAMAVLSELVGPLLMGVSLALAFALLFTCAVAALHGFQGAEEEVVLITTPEYSAPLLQVYEESVEERKEKPVYKEELVSAYQPPVVPPA